MRWFGRSPGLRCGACDRWGSITFKLLLQPFVLERAKALAG